MPYYGLETETLQNTTQSLPLTVGSVVAFLKDNLPTGFIYCDGRTIQSTAPLDPDYYPQLVEHLNPGQTTATVPDLRGQFLRGHSVDSSVDPDGPRIPGNSQTDEIEAHTHRALVRFISAGAAGGGSPVIDGGGGGTYPVTTDDQQPPGVTETRPKNIAVVWAIKASDTIINSTVYSEVDPSTLFASVTRSLKSQFDARLSTDSSDALDSTNGSSTIYLTPYNGNTIWLYNISKALWEPFELSTPTTVSYTLSGLTDRLPYDIFVYDNLGTVTLEAVAWTNVTTRATTLVFQDGIRVKNGELNKRYVGTFYAVSDALKLMNGLFNSTTTVMEWSLYNYYNQIDKSLSRLTSDNLVADMWTNGGVDTILNGNQLSQITLCIPGFLDYTPHYNATWGHSFPGADTLEIFTKVQSTFTPVATGGYITGVTVGADSPAIGKSMSPVYIEGVTTTSGRGLISFILAGNTTSVISQVGALNIKCRIKI